MEISRRHGAGGAENGLSEGMHDMEILVTGGLGMIGQPLVRELRSRGHSVWVCDLRHDRGPQFVRCDVASHRQLARLVGEHRFDLVYHLAAEFGRWNGEDYYETMWRSNVIGTRNVIDLQEKHRFRLVFTSSSEVYADFDGVMAEEVMDRHEIRQLNDYAISKWVNELQIMNAAKMAGTETVRVRIFNAYGPGEEYHTYRSVVCRLIYSALCGLPITVYRDHHRTLVYLSDAVRTLANVAERFRPGNVYNLGGTQDHSVKALSDLILKHTGSIGAHITYKDQEPFTTRNKRVAIDRAVKDLDHRADITLEEGIPKTIAWMRDAYREDIQAAVRAHPGA